MKPEITKIITTMMESYDEYYEEYIAEGIRSLANNWPSLTEDEKKEIEAAATAFSIMAIGEEDDEEEISQEEKLPQENFYEPTASTYSNNSNVKKIGLFRRK